MFNIFVITKSTEEYDKKCKFLPINLQCYHIPAQYLSNNVPERVYATMRVRHNIKRNHLKSKIGCMFAHRLALYYISHMYLTDNNIILEEDATLDDIKALKRFLKSPPKEPAYLGGWIINPLMKDIDKPVQFYKNKKPKTGTNNINYDKFRILMAHSIYIPNYKQAGEILKLSEYQALYEKKHKAMDHFYADNQLIKQFIYPPIFVQSDHVSEIDGSRVKKRNKNNLRTLKYGLYLHK